MPVRPAISYMLHLNTEFAEKFVSEKLLKEETEKALEAIDTLIDGTGEGNEMRGWLGLPLDIDDSTIEECNDIAKAWRGTVDAVVIVGIGGSYLGSKCAIEALSHTFASNGLRNNYPQILFAGNGLSQDYLADLLEYLRDKTYAVIVISKSGTTTEPAIAFRFLKKNLEERFEQSVVRERIVTITDANKGALREMSRKDKYSSFYIPDSVGGRFSVLTPVGLLPISVAGFDISMLARGAKNARNNYLAKSADNDAIRYAAIRNALYKSGKKIEIFANFNPKLHYFSEWLKQLYGESLGKQHKGIFPAAADFTTDLHSMGQYIQDGERLLFETAILENGGRNKMKIDSMPDDIDGLNYLTGRTMEDVNKAAAEGTRKAHVDGGVPNSVFEIDSLNEVTLGEMFYFFEISCAIDGYVLGVNPFDQEGVEEYKKNLFTLLGKPGYEKK